MKTSSKVVITIILTGAIVGGSIYYYVSSKAKQDKNELQTQIDDLNNKLVDSQGSSVLADPGSWQKYTNTTYNYSIKYPLGWIYEMGSDGAGVPNNNIVFYDSKAAKVQSNWAVGIDESDFAHMPTFTLNGKDEKLTDSSFEEFVSNYLPGEGINKVVSTKKIQTNSSPIYEVTYSGVDRGGDPTISYNAYYNLGNSHCLTFSLDSDSNPAVFGLMLATFQTTK